MTGILLFTFASLLGGLAQEPWQLLAARVLQGVGGAIASPTSLALITTTFPEGPERNRAFGVFTAAVSAGGGGAIGLLAGGMLTEWPTGGRSVRRRAHRCADRRAHAAVHQRVQRHTGRFDIFRGVHLDRGDGPARLRIHPGGRQRVAGQPDHRFLRGCRGSAAGLRLHRIPRQRTDHAAQDVRRPQPLWRLRDHAGVSPRRCSVCSSTSFSSCRKRWGTARSRPVWPSCR
ncbi:hypothetical protein SALBM311S_02207 [Streptomyces alboniger]